MRLMAAFKKPLQVSVAAALLLTSGFATAETVEEKPSAGAMVVDAVVVRPLYFALSQAGALFYGATLPFTLLGGNSEEAAEVLVVTPLQGAFSRCLGCGRIDNQVGDIEEGEGKEIRNFAMLTAGVAAFEQTDRSDNGKPTGTAPTGGVYLGTHFSLSDESRFDVLVGYRHFGKGTLKDDPIEYDVASGRSIQIASRFGKQVFGGIDVMGKLGFHSWSMNLEDNTSKESFSGTGFFGGLAFEKFISDDVRVGLDYTYYPIEDDEFTANVQTADLNLSYMF